MQDKDSPLASAVHSRASSLASGMDMDRIDLEEEADEKVRMVSPPCTFWHHFLYSPVVRLVLAFPISYPTSGSGAT